MSGYKSALLLSTTTLHARFFVALALLLVADAAQAHAVSVQAGDLYAGALHLLTSLEHVLPIIALGLLAAQRGLEKAQAVLGVFPLAVTIGVTIGPWLPPLPGLLLVNLVSCVVFGALVVAAWQPPMSIFLGLAGLFGFTHGMANGSAMTREINHTLFITGVALAAFISLAYVTTVVNFLLEKKRPAWIAIAVRVGGSWIAAIGILVLSISHKTLLLS